MKQITRCPECRGFNIAPIPEEWGAGYECDDCGWSVIGDGAMTNIVQHALKAIQQ